MLHGTFVDAELIMSCVIDMVQEGLSSKRKRKTVVGLSRQAPLVGRHVTENGIHNLIRFMIFGSRLDFSMIFFFREKKIFKKILLKKKATLIFSFLNFFNNQDLFTYTHNVCG